VLPNNCTKLQSDPFSASDYLIDATMTGLPDNTIESYSQIECSGDGTFWRIVSPTRYVHQNRKICANEKTECI
jgi:hypothetical protein